MCALLSEVVQMNFWNVLKFEGKFFLLNLYIAQEKNSCQQENRGIVISKCNFSLGQHMFKNANSRVEEGLHKWKWYFE